MSMSIGAMNYSPYASYNVKSMNYAVDNKSQLSDSFVEAANTAGVKYVNITAPVQYPNAYVDNTAFYEKAKEVNNAYNDVASRFDSQITGYGQNMKGSSYGMVGSNFDVYV